ncbi:MAG: hypothetical protein K8T91_24835 [Planctomycetes bacterium]|nr:hypothetical protein [Planctomycetota bacterium]
MSEYQVVALRAIDEPVSEKNLQYMHRQSTRAEITPWSFDNEYNFGDFHGNAKEMLRRGYALHLHYANFGVRTLLIRFPNGYPHAAAAKPYLLRDSIRFVKDKTGPGCILEINPDNEPDALEELWDIGEWVDRLVPLRAELLKGDLRPLYLAHLAMLASYQCDPEEAVEAPVPAGLQKLTDAQSALAEFYGLGKPLMDAAGRESPPLASQSKTQPRLKQWIRNQPAATKDSWLERLLETSETSVRSKILAEFQNSSPTPRWATKTCGRTLEQLQAVASEIEKTQDRKAAAKKSRRKPKKK